VGAVGGVCAAVLAVWFLGLGGQLGPSPEEFIALRLELADVRVRHADLLATLDARLEAVESGPAEGAVDAEARAASRALAVDMAKLRDALELELETVDAELRRLGSIFDEFAGDRGGPDPTDPLSEEDEPRYVVRSSDPDVGVRFSALVRLGRRRSDRSVQASLARLGDPDAIVIWIAVHNLGGFGERGAAPEIAQLLSHASALVRQESHAALLRLGAPADTGFDPLAPSEIREIAAATLRSWADQ